MTSDPNTPAPSVPAGDVAKLVEELPPDQQPGFWPEYVEPSTMARAIQMPLADLHWQNRVLNAYVSRKNRRARSVLSTQPKETPDVA